MPKEAGPTPKPSPIERGSVRSVYDLLRASSLSELLELYNEEDQRLMRSHAWDYKNRDLVVNKVKEALEAVDPVLLSDEEREARSEILWFWYHHAISAAIWRHHDLEAAKAYASKALAYQSEDHPNKITRLLSLLVNDNLAEAEQWAAGITDEGEASTARSLIEEYKNGDFSADRQYSMDELKGAILSSEQYADHPFARQEGKRTYEFEARNGLKKLTYFGTYHTGDPADPVLDEIAATFKKENPQMVYAEGIESANENKEGWRERLKQMSLEECRAEGETLYTLKLAVDAGADFESPEPAFAAEVQALLDKGFSKKDIFNFYVFRNIFQYQRNHAERERAECEKIVKQEAQRLVHRAGWDAAELDSFGTEILESLHLEDAQFYSDKVDPIPWEGMPQVVTNEISRTSSAFRDQYIFERIAEGLKKYDRLFVVYGSAHAVKQEMPLRFLVNQSATIQT